MSISPKPAILIVHGGFSLPDSWEICGEALSQAGFIVSCPRLPTCGDVRPPKATLQDDITAVRNAAKWLMSAGLTIIVLSHSWGGFVVSEAIHEDLYAKQEAGGYQAPGVIHLIYLSAWLVQPGKSAKDLFYNPEFPSALELGANEDGTAWVKNAPDALYNDVEAGQAEELAKKNTTSNRAELASKASRTPWKDIPTTFVYTTKDVAINPGIQRIMVQEANGAGGVRPLDEEYCDSGHSPFLSVPSELVQIVEKVWAKSQRKWSSLALDAVKRKCYISPPKTKLMLAWAFVQLSSTPEAKLQVCEACILSHLLSFEYQTSCLWSPAIFW